MTQTATQPLTQAAPAQLPYGTYTRLPDDSWGMRVAGAYLQPGDRVVLTKKDGSSHEATVGEVVRVVGGRNRVTLARITTSPRRKSTRTSRPRRPATPAPRSPSN